MSKHVFLLFYLLFLLAISSCNSPRKNDSLKNQKNVDSVIRDIPPDMQRIKIKKQKKEFENKIGLKSIEDGFEGTQIRIWNINSFLGTLQLLTILNSQLNWSAELHNIVYRMNDNNDSIVTFKENIFIKKPLSGWKSFTDSLFKLNILSLPDYSSIPEYDIPNDAGGVVVEIASKYRYRIYSYIEPEVNGVTISQAKMMYQILRLAEGEFKFKWQ